jgi:hypothetical protein
MKLSLAAIFENAGLAKDLDAAPALAGGDSAFSGSLLEVNLPDLLQLLHTLKKTGILSLSFDGRTAMVALRDGMIVSCLPTRITGDHGLSLSGRIRRTFTEALGAAHGRFEFASVSYAALETWAGTVSEGVSPMAAVLDLARREDEGRLLDEADDVETPLAFIEAVEMPSESDPTRSPAPAVEWHHESPPTSAFDLRAKAEPLRHQVRRAAALLREARSWFGKRVLLPLRGAGDDLAKDLTSMIGPGGGFDMTGRTARRAALGIAILAGVLGSMGFVSKTSDHSAPVGSRLAPTHVAPTPAVRRATQVRSKGSTGVKDPRVQRPAKTSKSKAGQEDIRAALQRLRLQAASAEPAQGHQGSVSRAAD